MRIFFASHDCGTHASASRTWYNNLYLPLKDIANEVVRLDFDLFPMAQHQDFTKIENANFIKENRPKLEEELLQQIKKEHNRKPIEVFFSYFASAYCSSEVIREIGEMGIVTVNWFCNASYQFHLIQEVAPAYHYCLVPEKFRIEDYKNIGANPIHCQEAANPNIYKKVESQKDISVSFVGSHYGNRPKYIRHLLAEKIDVKVWGEDWIEAANIQNQISVKDSIKELLGMLKRPTPLSLKSLGGFLSDEEMIDVFNRSKINLGFSATATGTDIKQVRLRDFEIPMCGGFYLTEKCEELADFFEPDKEIVFFESAEECTEKIKYYLSHTSEREEIAAAAYKRAQNEHTWQKRLKSAFSEMDLLKKF